MRTAHPHQYRKLAAAGLALVTVLAACSGDDDASTPVPTTAAPAPTTTAPTTAAPVPTTLAPVPTTLAPAPTTLAPVPTTLAPAPTTTAPEVIDLAPGEALIDGELFFTFNSCFTTPLSPNSGAYQVESHALLDPDTGMRVSIDLAVDEGSEPWMIFRYFDFETAEPVEIDRSGDVIEVDVVGGGDDNVFPVQFRPAPTNQGCDRVELSSPDDEFAQYNFTVVDACIVTEPAAGFVSQIGLYLSEAAVGSLTLNEDLTVTIRLREYSQFADYVGTGGTIELGEVVDTWQAEAVDESSGNARTITATIDPLLYRPCGEFEFILAP